MSPESHPDLADFLQRFATKVLWHFTGYNKTPDKAFEILKAIIGNQTLKVSLDYQRIKMPSGQERIGWPAACMCDIPFKDLRIHTCRYGQYGIAFKKNNAIIRGHFNPVFYIQHDFHLFKHSEALLNKFDNEHTNNAINNKELHEFLMLIGTYAKRSDLTRAISVTDVNIDTEQNNNFYYEREWRSAYEWKFQKDDVAAILVPNFHLEAMKQFINSDIHLNSFNGVPLISHELVELL